MKNKVQEIKKYIIILLVTTISIFIAIDYINSIKGETDVIVSKSLNDQMEKSNEFISNYLDNKIEVLRNIGQTYEKGNIKTVSDLQNYGSVLVDGNEFEFISIIDKNGNLFLSDNRSIDIRHKKYFIEGIKGKVVISNVVDEITSKGNCISICVPIYKDNEIISFIFAVKNAEDLQSELVANLNEDTGFTCITDMTGNVILRTENSFKDEDFSNFYHYMMYKDVGLDAYVERVRNGLSEDKKEIINVSDNDVNGYLGYSAVSKNSDWRIVSYLGEDKFLSYINNVSTESFKMIIYIVLLILFATLYFLRSEIIKKRELQRISSIDNLTKIGNLLKFLTETKKILNKHNSDEYIMVVFDIKKFKYINHNYGYNYGDYLLKVIARAINKRFDKGETCARINGDSFMILAKNHKNFSVELNEFLMDTIYKSNSKGKDIILNFNYGFYIIKNKKEPISEMIDKANLAWKHVKITNKIDTYYYDENLMKYLMEEEELEKNMKDALINGEFKVYLQAMINLENNKLCGAEALVRWISPEMGFLPPDRFISLFEKNGFIVDMDFYVLEVICKKLNMLTEIGINDFVFSVNQSRETISDPDYIKNLVNLVKKYNISPRLIELEVTENIFIDSYEKILKILHQVRELGFNISMDDFGSGYSSLNLLKEMPISILKIDRLFLNETSNSSRGKLIIKSVIELAKNLQINVVCEGVETKENEAFLKSVSCEMAQGYLYGKPIPMEEFNQLIR
jgi:diguanylate cyclase (GGDEF)-like protein